MINPADKVFVIACTPVAAGTVVMGVVWLLDPSSGAGNGTVGCAMVLVALLVTWAWCALSWRCRERRRSS